MSNEINEMTIHCQMLDIINVISQMLYVSCHLSNVNWRAKSGSHLHLDICTSLAGAKLKTPLWWSEQTIAIFVQAPWNRRNRHMNISPNDACQKSQGSKSKKNRFRNPWEMLKCLRATDIYKIYVWFLMTGFLTVSVASRFVSDTHKNSLSQWYNFDNCWAIFRFASRAQIKILLRF